MFVSSGAASGRVYNWLFLVSKQILLFMPQQYSVIHCVLQRSTVVLERPVCMIEKLLQWLWTLASGVCVYYCLLVCPRSWCLSLLLVPLLSFTRLSNFSFLCEWDFIIVSWYNSLCTLHVQYYRSLYVKFNCIEITTHVYHGLRYSLARIIIGHKN